jgi:hypothetical protein
MAREPADTHALEHQHLVNDMALPPPRRQSNLSIRRIQLRYQSPMAAHRRPRNLRRVRLARTSTVGRPNPDQLEQDSALAGVNVRSRLSLTTRPNGIKVHLQILPRDPLSYIDTLRRTHLLAS